MKCRFEHDGDCCNSGATQYMCKCKQPCDTIIPITNADRIRAMSDEELADWLARNQIANVAEALAIAKIPYEIEDNMQDAVKKDCLEWLQQPVKESED